MTILVPMRKTVVLTGANRGIGLEMARCFAEQGCEILAACRESSDALNSLVQEAPVRVVQNIDVTSSDGANTLRDAARDWLGDEQLHILVNNAGRLRVDSLQALDFEEMQRQFETNTLGPLRISAALLPLLGVGSKIAMISSRMGSIADNSSGTNYGYRMSKCALNIASVNLAHDVQSRGVAVGIFHPGYVRTDMTSHNGNVDPRAAAAALVARIGELNLQNSGRFVHAQGELLPW